ncbi:WYL domain-containing protein [Anatilimnocola floriformis]|uniref:WYL domain-containing protein n=1 Tax=Anatilimnocola floriformis TaxID=2948575 RepID=UPI0020C1ED2A|nr:hypothetical protein [Anatilimnocola floriformis]
MQALINRALRQADELVLVFNYMDSKGVVSRRVVSPVRMIKGERLMALCLSREEPRQFHLKRCSQMRLEWASNFVMPVPMVRVPLEQLVATLPPAKSVAEPQAAA